VSRNEGWVELWIVLARALSHAMIAGYAYPVENPIDHLSVVNIYLES
jgi:hypothetical protein